MHSKIITIDANGSTKKSHKAAVIYCTEGPSNYDLIIKYGEQTSRLIKGWAYPLVDGFEIYNLSAEDQAVEFVYLNEHEAELFKDSRMIESGEQVVSGHVGVTGQPLTSQGGSVVPLGESIYAEGIDQTALGAETTEIVSAATNVNGIWLRTASIILMTKGVGGATGTAWIGDTNGQFLHKFNVGSKGMEGDKFIAAGKSLRWRCPADCLTYCYLSYDLN